jgi:hypothetical protein
MFLLFSVLDLAQRPDFQAFLLVRRQLSFHAANSCSFNVPFSLKNLQ